jgi:hypothetical protein
MAAPSCALIIDAGASRVGCADAAQAAHVLAQLGCETTLAASPAALDAFFDAERPAPPFILVLLIGTLESSSGELLVRTDATGSDTPGAVPLSALFAKIGVFSRRFNAGMWVVLDVGGHPIPKERAHNLSKTLGAASPHVSMNVQIPVERGQPVTATMPWPAAFRSPALARPYPARVGRITAAFLCSLLGAARSVSCPAVMAMAQGGLAQVVASENPQFPNIYMHGLEGSGMAWLEFEHLLDPDVRRHMLV